MALLLSFLLLCGSAGLTGSVTIAASEPTTQGAAGTAAVLPCTFTLSPEDEGPLDVEWLFLQPEHPDVDHVIILYAMDRVYDSYYLPLKGRVHFASNNLKSGDASLNITNLQLSDTGTYQCKVKKAPGIAKRSIWLTVVADQ